MIDWSATGTSVTWATNGNWDGNVAPANSLTQDIARFDKTSYAFQPNAGTTSIAGLQIGDGSTATSALTLAGTALSIGSSGITMSANAGAATITATSTKLGGDQNWVNNSSEPLDGGCLDQPFEQQCSYSHHQWLGFRRNNVRWYSK